MKVASRCASAKPTAKYSRPAKTCQRNSWRNLAKKSPTALRREYPFLKSAAPKKDAPTTVALVAEGKSPEQAAELLRRIVSETRKRQDQIFDENTTLLTDRLAVLDRQTASLEQQFNEATRLLSKLEDSAPVQASLLMIERGQLSEAMRSLAQERFAASRQLTPPLTQRTTEVGEIIAPESPSAPKRMLVIAMSVVLGFFGGVMAAFFFEFVARARESA